MNSPIIPLAASLPRDLVNSASPIGLTVNVDLKKEDARLLLKELAHLVSQTVTSHHTSLIWLGDALALQPSLRRGELAAWADLAGVSRATLRNVKMVCLRIPVSCRRDALSWSHHMEVGLATGDREKITALLDRAVKEELSVRDFRKVVRESLREKDSQPPTDEDLSHAFKVLRELDASMRVIAAHRATWSGWNAAQRAKAYERVGPLLEFLTALQQPRMAA